MKTGLMVTGGQVDLEQLEMVIQTEKITYVVGVDHGMDYLYQIQYKPDILLGDFDSCDKKVLAYYTKMGVKRQNYKVDKDATDTHLAFEHLKEMGMDKIIVLGSTGTRIDHTIGTLMVASKYAKFLEIIVLNKYNRINIVYNKKAIKKSHYTYLSILPLTEEVKGVTLTGVAYPVEKATFNRMDSYGISNQIVGEEAIIKIETGILLVIESKDK